MRRFLALLAAAGALGALLATAAQPARTVALAPVRVSYRLVCTETTVTWGPGSTPKTVRHATVPCGGP